jgi:hypothetical protein
MAFQSAQKSRVALGLLNLSGYTKKVDFGGQSAMLDVTTLADAAQVFMPGQDTSSVAIDMLLDASAATDSQFDVLNDFKATTPLPLTYGPVGLLGGAEVWLIDALNASTTIASDPASAVMVSLTAQPTGVSAAGLSLADFTTSTAAGAASTAAVDFGAATTGALVAHLHVSAFSGFTDETFVVRHCATEGGVYADVTGGTFTTVTGVGGLRLAIPATSVNRWIKLQWTPTGTGSVTFHGSLARL